MSVQQSSYTLRVGEGINTFTAAEWNRLSGASRNSNTAYNPFISHAFLSSLEDSGCVSRASGWRSQFLRLEDENGQLLAAAPSYLKGHSQGEYVFDHGWANAFEQAGGSYYPKLQLSVPFTPVTGPRLLYSQDANPSAARQALAQGIRQLTERLGVSSAHVTFLPEDELPALVGAGFLHRIDQQFHFLNQGYDNYDDFLSTLQSRKRKALKKERREALDNGITIEQLTGADLTESVWDDFFDFYTDTGNRKWGRPYLNRRFFSLIGERMRQDILLVMAKRNGRYIAGAINFIGSDRLFGRNWGCIEDHPFLHFEVCYHQAIDFAIAHRLAVVEAGAQGEHKLARGYVPVTTHSAHFIAHDGFRKAVEDYLQAERRDVAGMGDLLQTHTPFRKTQD